MPYGNGEAMITLLPASILKNKMEYAVKNNIFPEIDLANTTVSVHLATLNEEVFVESTLQSLVSQKIYQQYHDSGSIELVLVDSHSEDKTVEIAKPYVDKVLDVSRGKMTARREAIEQTDADIIISVDSGDFYPPIFANLLLRWFRDPEVVAVTGSEVPTAEVPLILSTFQIWENYAYHRLQGRGMAMRRDAFFKSGGWDETVNQYNVLTIQREEEKRFYYKMKSVGKVITDNQAVVYAVPRRFMWRSRKMRKYQKEIIKKGRF